MKAGGDLFRAWGGIAGCQSLLNVMLDEGHYGRGLPLEKVVALLSGNVAGRFDFLGKGRLEVGADADIALVDPDVTSTLWQQDLFYRHKISPLIGRALHGKIVCTMVRGITVFREGKIVSEPVGRLVKPARSTDRTPQTERTVQKGA
jgi:allantoinase